MSREYIKNFYEQRWKRRKKNNFWQYERNKVLEKFFRKTTKKAKVLDVACGNGATSQFFQSQGYRVWGMDISKAAISEAKRFGKGNFIVGDIEEGLPYKTCFFDVVFLGDILEHLLDPLSVLREARRVLKTDGRVVISVPNMSFLLYRWHYLKTGQVAITEGHKAEIWDTGHIRLFSIDSIKKLLNKVGFKISVIDGVSAKGIFSRLANSYPKLFTSIIIIEGVVEK